MCENQELIELEEEIYIKREKLGKLYLKDRNSPEVIKLSEKLDVLILKQIQLIQELDGKED